MDKKNNEKRMKQWLASCWIVSLAQQCKNRENQAKNKNIYSLLF